jgi:hypothetical protein
MLYKNLEALEPLRRLVLEASEGLATASRTIDTSSMKEVLGAAAGAGVGGTLSFVALYYAGTVGLSAVGITSALGAIGGTMLGGMVVLALPIVVLGVGGHVLIAKKNRRRLVQAKEALLQEIEARRDQVLRSLEQRLTLSEERARYLESLNVALAAAIRDLQNDLAPA